MGNAVISSNLMVTDNIKDELFIYYWVDITYGAYGGYNWEQYQIKPDKHIFKPKFNYIFSEQQKKIFKYHISISQLVNFIYKNIAINKIPKRYSPTLVDISKKAFLTRIEQNRRITLLRFRLDDRRKNLPNLKYHKCFQLILKEPIISLIEQKFSNEISLISFLKSLNEHNGLGFDEYIDNWVKRILEEQDEKAA